MNLQNWVSQARDHWKEFQPTRYKRRKADGQLEAELQLAAELTYQEMSELENQGYNEHEAWEMVRQTYLFPAEEAGLDQFDPTDPADVRQKQMYDNLAGIIF